MTDERFPLTAAALAKGEMIDRLISIDLPRRGVIELIHREAREHQGLPLAMAAAHLLANSVAPTQVVLIATGWLDRPNVSTSIAESDGPPGAAALGRALHAGLGVVPIFLVEEEITDAMTLTVQAAGLRCLSPAEAVTAAHSPAAIHAASVVALSADSSIAQRQAEELCTSFDVGAFISIEKGGQNEFGRIHTSRGHDTTQSLSKADAVLEVCQARGIPTVGIGDGGNEIGMGTIRDRLKGKLRFSDQCECGCGGGVVPLNHTDVLVATTVSNWGAYGIATALACLLGRPDVMHSPTMEEDLLRASAAAGFIDGVSGYVAPTADGLSLRTHISIVTLLRAIVGYGVDSAAWS